MAKAGALLGRVKRPGPENFCGYRRVVPGMREIAEKPLSFRP